MAYVLNVRMTAREGEEERAAELIRQLAAATQQEPGNIQWVGHRSVENPRTFMVYEQYRDEDAFKEHGQTEHFKSIGLEQLFPLMEGERERLFFETLD
jgi:quinol monooxygenase YgiN